MQKVILEHQMGHLAKGTTIDYQLVYQARIKILILACKGVNNLELGYRSYQTSEKSLQVLGLAKCHFLITHS